MDIICPHTFTRENISTPTCVNGHDGASVPGGKVPQLLQLSGTFLQGVGDAEWRRRVVFFDDSEPNVVGARNDGWKAFHTPKGFSRGVWAALAAGNPQIFSPEECALGML